MKKQIKRVFCPWCGANIIDDRNPWFWFKYSPWYVWHLFWCARPHGIGWFLVYYDAHAELQKLGQERLDDFVNKRTNGKKT